MPHLTGPDDARQTVEYWADRGVTSFKAYMNITRAELKAAIDAAHKRGIKVTGHLCSVTYKEAAELGIDDLEHGFFVNTQLDTDKKPDVCSQSEGDETLARMDPGSPEAKDLINTPRRPSCGHHFDAAGLRRRPGWRASAIAAAGLDAMSPQSREDFFLLRQRLASAPAPKIDPALLWKHDLDLERAFVAAGGLLLAGPDPTGRGDVLPGFGDQREIELLVEAGFSPRRGDQDCHAEWCCISGQGQTDWLGCCGKERRPSRDQWRSIETDFGCREGRNRFQGWRGIRLAKTFGFGAGAIWTVLRESLAITPIADTSSRRVFVARVLKQRA